jgi:hypothetical protein
MPKVKGSVKTLQKGSFLFPLFNVYYTGLSKKGETFKVRGIVSALHAFLTLLVDILRQRTHDNDLKEYAVSVLRESGSFEKTKGFLLEVEQEARQLIREFGGNEQLEVILNILCRDYSNESK